ncbi:hypothetical protein [Pseudomonas sp. dw_612]|uniref:hypothetical protein n=1 Tax=Pseudomonas sp. dw_612 TaxID=2720080 RepID=UPI001BD275A2|nr:hypothetical protein [Pseudomonas sp. dw_612]
MRVENLYIICILNGLDEDTLHQSAEGLFYKYAGREGTSNVELWDFRRTANTWAQKAVWNGKIAYSGDIEIRSEADLEQLNAGLRTAKNPGGGDAGAIVVAHGAVGSLAGTPAADVAKKVGAQAVLEGWPVFRKIVLEVCRSGTINPKDQAKDPTVAQQFLKAYATAVDTNEPVMIVGYDAAVSVAYKGKEGMPEDAYDDDMEALPAQYGRKFLMQHDVRYNGDAVWMSAVKGNEHTYTDLTKKAKRAFNYLAIKNKPKPIATEIALDGWSDRM